MRTDTIRRLTGFSGLIAALLMLAELALFFVYPDAPPDSNVYATTLFAITAGVLLFVFMIGFWFLVKAADPGYEFVGALAAIVGVMWVLLATFVFLSLGVGAVIASDHPIDQTIEVTGTYLLGGAIGRIIEALWMAAFGYAIMRTRVMPRWIGWICYVLVPINLAFVPSIYFGNDPRFFYAANGWGTAACMGFLTILWFLLAGIAVLAAKTPQMARR